MPIHLRNPVPDLDWGYRPADYRDHPDAVSATLSAIKGEWRREAIRWDLTQRAVPHTWNRDEIYVESLTPGDRHSWGVYHPCQLGGEYLPDLMPGEAEIARVVVASLTCDVISVRARRSRRGYRYRIVDEYPEYGPYHTVPVTSRWPLSLGELIGLINRSANRSVVGADKALPDRIRDLSLADGACAADLRDLVTVRSDVYQELQGFYEWQAMDWFRAHGGMRTAGRVPNPVEWGDDDEGGEATPLFVPLPRPSWQDLQTALRSAASGQVRRGEQIADALAGGPPMRSPTVAFSLAQTRVVTGRTRPSPGGLQPSPRCRANSTKREGMKAALMAHLRGHGRPAYSWEGRTRGKT